MAVDPFWAALAVRMVVTAAIVVAASLAVERAGPSVGGLVATLPVSVGPAYAFLAMDHGPAFIAETALAGLVSLPATAAFLVVYVAIAPHARMVPSLAAAIATWFATLALLNVVRWSVSAAFLTGLAANLAGLAIMRPWRRAARSGGAGPKLRAMAVRALAVLCLVAAVTAAGRLSGPHAAGLASLFPIVFTSLIALLHDRIGGTATAATSAHAIAGMIGYGFGFALLNLSAVPLGSAVSLLLSLGAIVGWNGLLLALGRRLGRQA